jgi:hypothetical protein
MSRKNPSGWVLAAALLAAGCLPSDPAPRAGTAVASTTRDLSSPELALRSYWEAQDRFESGPEGRRLKEASDEAQAPFLTGHEAAFAKILVIPYIFERVIVERTVLPDGRVMFLANVRNRSPFPPDVQVNDYVRERRELGDGYRYVLEPTDTGWRIAEILVYLPHRSPPVWERRHSLEPFVTTHTKP